MLDLNLREEFRGKKIDGTTVEFTKRSGSGALEVPADAFLRITYPSADLLHAIEAISPGQSHPVVLMAPRGQGKSHLLAALYHLCNNSSAGQAWLDEWSHCLKRPEIGDLKLRQGCTVIAESLSKQEYRTLWDLLFAKHPDGAFFKGKWEGTPEEHKGDSPSASLLAEMFAKHPTVLILDEYQTWYDGLTNSRVAPKRNWAFNFIQNLSEIASDNPENLALVVSVRDGTSDAYQQIHRVKPVVIDFKGPLAKRDRQRLLLYRIFENRMQVPQPLIEQAIRTHASEYFRLAEIAQPDQPKAHDEFLESWPYAPQLLKLLDDQVLIATAAQETRDLIRILVDLFKTVGSREPVITAADFSLTNETGGVVSLLDSVTSELHRELRDKAIRNLEAVKTAVPHPEKEVPHADEIIASLWLRSLTVDRLVGADPADLQIDITRGKAIDDNQFQVELAAIEENSFNIHRVGTRLVFQNEDNPRAKLLAHAKNDKLFHAGEDIEHLAKEVRSVLSAPETVSQSHRVIVLKTNWQSDPWSEFEEKDRPKNWDGRLAVVVIPEYPEKPGLTLGTWLKTQLSDNRNTIRFLLPPKGIPNIYYDRELLILARAVYLAMQWRKNEPAYSDLQKKFQSDLTAKLKGRFDRFAILTDWNFAEPEKCVFEEKPHGALGDKIPDAIDAYIKQSVFEPEAFEELVEQLAARNESVGKLLGDLREPRPGGKPCIPWLGEIEVKERVLRMCARGQIAINVRGLEMLQVGVGESYDNAWHRIKGKLSTGKHLDETLLHKPQAIVSSSGKTATGGEQQPAAALSPSGEDGQTAVGPGTTSPQSGAIGRVFTPRSPGIRTPHSATPTSNLNLLGRIEEWGIRPATPVANVTVKIAKLTGSQLEQLLKQLPDGVTYGLDLEKESE